MGLSQPSSRWSPWIPEAFARAEGEGKPILLAIGTSWSLGTRAMAGSTYRDDAVNELIDTHFVPIWVDADDRPDVADRYGLGGWPTTAFLTADGRMLGGQTFTRPPEMVALLRRVATAFDRRRAELTRRTPPEPAPGRGPTVRSAETPDEGVAPWLIHHLLEAYDPECGGFGRGRKHLDEAPLLFALRCAHDGHAALRSAVGHTLDRATALLDEVDGGCFHYAERRDWSQPCVEKLATVNAAALRVFAEAWRVLGDPRWRDRVRSIADYVERTLVAETGFFPSQAADPEYYGADVKARLGMTPPPIDCTVYTGPSAELAQAFIQAGARLDDTTLIEQGVAALDRLVTAVYRPGAGVAHAVGRDDARGLLVDQLSVADALVAAHEATEGEVYVDLAMELVLHAARTLWHTERGVFVDRVVAADDIGLLRRTLSPFVSNCRAAGVLLALARRTGHRELAARATTVLAGQAATARTRSLDAAHYALALLARDAESSDRAS